MLYISRDMHRLWPFYTRDNVTHNTCTFECMVPCMWRWHAVKRIRAHACMHVCMYIYTYIHTYAYTSLSLYIYIYIHIHTHTYIRWRSDPPSQAFLSRPANLVSVNKNTPQDEKTGWEISSWSAKSGAGLQFLLMGRMAKAQAKNMFFSQTPVGVSGAHRMFWHAETCALFGTGAFWLMLYCA